MFDSYDFSNKESQYAVLHLHLPLYQNAKNDVWTDRHMDGQCKTVNPYTHEHGLQLGGWLGGGGIVFGQDFTHIFKTY